MQENIGGAAPVSAVNISHVADIRVYTLTESSTPPVPCRHNLKLSLHSISTNILYRKQDITQIQTCKSTSKSSRIFNKTVTNKKWPGFVSRFNITKTTKGRSYLYSVSFRREILRFQLYMRTVITMNAFKKDH